MKRLTGVQRAYEEGSPWMMFLDADDLVSRRLEDACKLKNHDAVILRGGYLWDASRGVLRRSFSLHKSCASTHIVKLEPRWFPYWLGGATDGPRIADQSHNEIRTALLAMQSRLQDIYSPMIAYRVGSMTSLSRNQISYAFGISAGNIKDFFLQKKISDKIIDDFSMRSLSAPLHECH